MRSVRLAIAAGVFAIAVGLVVFTTMAFLRSNPSTVDFVSRPQLRPARPPRRCRPWAQSASGPTRTGSPT